MVRRPLHHLQGPHRRPGGPRQQEEVQAEGTLPRQPVHHGHPGRGGGAGGGGRGRGAGARPHRQLRRAGGLRVSPGQILPGHLAQSCPVQLSHRDAGESGV